ncbi:MAG: hypothetical protein F4201_10630 [Nitrospira sp. SB0677_bin_15]|nr:hypothetical protein [Nitrospira sp. SB0677_bin_15]
MSLETGGEISAKHEPCWKIMVDNLHSKCKTQHVFLVHQAFQVDMGSAAMPGYVVHPGDICLPFGPDVTVLPFAKL